MEAHNNRAGAITQLKKLVESFGCEFSQVSDCDAGNDKFGNLQLKSQNAKNDSEVIRECIKTERGPDSVRIKVWHVVDWKSVHNPILDWTIADEISGNPSAPEVDERILNVLNDERYFGICSDCHIRLDRAWMLGAR
ncbi:MAG: hypothetical protein LC768_13375 [Acidobacteria bacterium]|nr:hypothetical protein [Acidobacteriota bacterium]